MNSKISISRREFGKMSALAVAATATAAIEPGRDEPLTVCAVERNTEIRTPQAFAHMAVRSHDLSASRAWYKTVLACNEPFGAPFAAWQTYDEEHHRVSLLSTGGAAQRSADTGGCDHFTYVYQSLQQLLSVYARLESQGIQPLRSVTYGPTTSFFYADPSGNGIELLVNEIDSTEDLERYCSNGILASDSGGKPVDPHKLIDSEEAKLSSAAIAPKGMTSVVIRTPRYQHLIGWYRTVLGCRITYQNDRVTFLSYDEHPHRIAIVSDPKAKPPDPQSGFDHFAFEYKNLEDLIIHTYARLKNEGIRPYWSTNHGMTTSLYYPDPDGNRIEIQVDNFPTKAEGLKYINGPQFAANPVGIDFDPDELGDKIKGGASYEELHYRVEGPRTTPVPSSAPSPWRVLG